MQNSNILACFKLAVLLLLGSLSWFPQNATGSIKGIVKDPSGWGLPGVEIVFESTGGGRAAIALSNSLGQFEASDVLAGTYRLDFLFATWAYKNDKITVRPNEITTLEIKVSYEANCPVDPNGVVLQLSDLDRTEIIYSILEDSLVKNLISDGHGLLKKQKSPIILSLDTIKAEWVKKPAGTDIAMMTEKEVRQKANKSGDYLHLSFSNWHVGTSCVVVTLNNSWAVADDSPLGYLSGGGRSYVYKKENGRWMGRSIGGWIS